MGLNCFGDMLFSRVYCRPTRLEEYLVWLCCQTHADSDKKHTRLVQDSRIIESRRRVLAIAFKLETWKQRSCRRPANQKDGAEVSSH